MFWTMRSMVGEARDAAAFAGEGGAATYSREPNCAMSAELILPSRSAALPPHQHQPTK